MKYFWQLACVFLWAGCVHSGADEKEPPPEIYGNMPLEDALEAGMAFGGKTLADVKKLIKRRGEATKAGKAMGNIMGGTLDDLSDERLLNASHLYFATTMPGHDKIFVNLIRSDRELAKRIGWRLAAVRTSPGMGQLIEQELTRAINKGAEKEVLYPEMAAAVANNRLTESYTLLREGLYQTGDQEFVRGMIALSPDEASSDFLYYLSQASAEELRQLTVVNVDLMSCIAILKHMNAHPPAVSHPAFSHLFLYAVSRNRGLGDLAQVVLDHYVPHYLENLASSLASLPGWVQIAYLENARRNMTAKRGLLVSELEHATARPEVIDEIHELQR